MSYGVGVGGGDTHRHRGPVIEVLRSLRETSQPVHVGLCSSSAEDGLGLAQEQWPCRRRRRPSTGICSFDVLWELVVGMYKTAAVADMTPLLRSRCYPW